jgi:hypothetical protein
MKRRFHEQIAALMKIFIRIVFYCIGVVAILALGIRVGFWLGGEVNHVRSLTSRCWQIEACLLDYHRVHGRFPDPVFVTNGLSHSWRVMLLFDPNREHTRSGYDFSKPWNSPSNIEVANEGGVFTGPRAPIDDCVAKYLTIAQGEEWPATRPLRSYLVTKGEDQFLIVEDPDSTIHWMEPRY